MDPLRRWRSLLAATLVTAICALPGTVGAQTGLTHNNVVTALYPYRYVAYWHTSDGHRGTLGAAEGVSSSNGQLYRFVFWIGARKVRAFNLYAARITDATPDAITVMTSDVRGGQRAYIVFRWNGSTLVSSRPLPTQYAIGGTSGSGAGTGGGSNSSSGSGTSATVSQPGYLGIEMTDAPSDWTVQGCEVVHVYPGTPAALMGLVGSEDRTDPVGDVIYSVVARGATYWTPTCAALSNVLASSSPGETIQVAYYHRVVDLLSASWEAEEGVATLATQPCPSPLTGSITPSLLGNRIDLTVKIVGPNGSTSPQTVILDTGGVHTSFPDAMLRSLGFSPYWSMSTGGIVSGASETTYLYHIPAADFLVLDNGLYEPVASGTLEVWGLTNSSDEAFGPDILKLGDSFSNNGSTWTLTLACPR
ncbi:MAG: hypothetical protein M0Z94_02780 [Dehalococcoidales bacterium]|nr:hypothetical protein [Dehalococcoidales bacterium]